MANKSIKAIQKKGKYTMVMHVRGGVVALNPASRQAGKRVNAKQRRVLRDQVLTALAKVAKVRVTEAPARQRAKAA